MSSHDVDTLSWAVEKLRQIMKSDLLSSMVGPEFAPGEDIVDGALTEWLQHEAKFAGQWVGSLRAGSDPGLSAVDPQLSLRGIDGIKVAGELLLPCSSTCLVPHLSYFSHFAQMLRSFLRSLPPALFMQLCKQ